MQGFGNKILNNNIPFEELKYFLKHGSIKVFNRNNQSIHDTDELVSLNQKQIF